MSWRTIRDLAQPVPKVREPTMSDLIQRANYYARMERRMQYEEREEIRRLMEDALRRQQ